MNLIVTGQMKSIIILIIIIILKIKFTSRLFLFLDGVTYAIPNGYGRASTDLPQTE